MAPDPNTPSLAFMLIRSNALLAAAITLRGWADPLCRSPSEPVKALAEEYERFVERPIADDPEEA